MSDGPFRPLGGGADRPPGEEPPGPPGPRPGPPRPPAAARSVTWIAGVAVVLALAYITWNTIATDAPGSRGVEEGEPLPPFAAPLVIGGPEGDAQVDPARACSVRGERILNSCELRDEAPAALAFIASRSDRCADQLDLLEREAAEGGVRLAAVAIRGSRGEVTELVRRRGWDLPVAWDRDGAVANLFAVAVCPTITFVDAGGRVDSTTLGFADAAEVRERLEAVR